MASDIQTKHFVFRNTPEAWHPYISLMRLDRPIGTWLLLFPCWWAVVLAHGNIFSLDIRAWMHVILFGLGALVMRGAGCVINDIWDMKLDAQVERTKTRPLASGAVSKKQALLFLTCLLLIGLAILISLQSKLAAVLGIFSLLLVITYPLMKRITWWPQLFLGFTFNWGALLAFAAETQKLSLGIFMVYIGGILWTLAYDTIYAHQDKTDDNLIGIKSTALLFGDKSKAYVGYFFAGALLLLISGKFLLAPSIITPILSLPALAHIIWQIKNWDMNNPESCLAMFRANALFGWLVLLMFSL